jgi:hypothetical protein
MPPPASVDYESPWKLAQKSVEEQDQLPVAEQTRLLRETPAVSSDIAISGPLAFVSLASLVLVIVAALYRLYRYKMNKGYMVIVEKA